MLELLFKAQLGEFDALKKEQEGRRVTRDMLAYFTLVILSGVLVAVERTGNQLFLLGAWFVCMALGAPRLFNDVKVHRIRVYIRDKLSKKIRATLEAMPDAQELLNGPQGEQIRELLDELLAWEAFSLEGRDWRRYLHLIADMVLFVLPTLAAPFLAVAALDAELGTGPAAAVIVGLLLAAAPLAWGFRINAR